METVPNPAGGERWPIPQSYTALTAATDHLATASVLLAEWHDQKTRIDRSYVRAGGECIDAIDAALRELHSTRSALIGELRRDEDERFVRVDALLAESRAARAAREATS